MIQYREIPFGLLSTRAATHRDGKCNSDLLACFANVRWRAAQWVAGRRVARSANLPTEGGRRGVGGSGRPLNRWGRQEAAPVFENALSRGKYPVAISRRIKRIRNS